MAWPPTNDSQPEDAEASLDERLTRSAPPGTPATPELEEELNRLAVQARLKARGRRGAGRLRLSRGASVGLAALMVLGGGAAAVGVVELRSYWADQDVQPHGSYSFELPSGAECEVERRMLSMGPPGVENTGDLEVNDEQDALAQQMHSDAQSRVDEFITTDEFQDEVTRQGEVSGHQGMTDDVIYFHAVTSMLDYQLHDDYRDDMQEIRLGGVAMGHSCPGADFEDSGLDIYGNMDAHESQRGESGG